MARDRRRTIYSQDATVITEGATAADEAVVKRSVPEVRTTREISVEDAIDTMAAYLLPKFKVEKDSSNPGECVFCGKETAYQMRHLCVDCMSSVSSDLYRRIKSAIAAGETEIRM